MTSHIGPSRRKPAQWIWFWSAACLFLTNAAVFGQDGRTDEPRIIERFEGVESSWRVRSGQQAILVQKHIRTSEEKRSGNQSEFIHFKTVGQAKASLVHSLKTAQVINDYSPFIWIKSNQDSIRMAVRVVLPQTPNPVGSGSLKVLVELDRSKETDQWVRLGGRPGDLVRGLNARLRGIQFQFRKLKIETQDAYCDLLVLDGFDRQQAEYKIWFDDLSHLGFLPAKGIGADVDIGSRVTESNQQIEIRDGRFRINSKPFFLRAVEHNGESLGFLRQLGFNAVLMDRLPTLVELEQAQQYQVWILCPPIHSGPDSRELLKSKNLEMVFAWNIGSELTSRELETARKKTERTKAIRANVDRPRFCHAHFPIQHYSGLVSFFRLKHKTHGTSFSAEQFRRYLTYASSQSSPVIVDVQTELPNPIQQQGKLLTDPFIANGLTRGQILGNTYQALSIGARGLIFRSSDNLQQKTELATWLVPVLRSINRELIQIDPWIAGGTRKSSPDSRQQAVTFQLPRSQLTVAWKKRRLTGKPVQTRNSTLTLESTQQAPRVYKICESGMVPVHHQNLNGRLKIELSRNYGWERFLVSEDSLSFEYVQQATKAFIVDGGILNDKFVVQSQELERVKRIAEKLAAEQISSPALFSSLVEMDKSLSMIKTFLNRKQTTTVETLIAKNQTMLDQVSSSLSQELDSSRQLVSSPFNSDFSQLVNYVAFEKLLRRQQWSNNLLASGGFDSLELMSRDGWKQNLNATGPIQATIGQGKKEEELNSELPATAVDQQMARFRSGTGKLVIQTWATTRSNPQEIISVTPVWLASPEIKVQRNQVVRVEGFIRIKQQIQNSIDGFMILDSIGGPEMGSRFSSTDGWQYFAIERIVPQSMDFQLIFAQTGLGKVELSNLQLRVCQLELDQPSTGARLAENRESQPLNPQR